MSCRDDINLKKQTVLEGLSAMLDLVLAIGAALSAEDVDQLNALLADRESLMQKLGPEIQSLRQMELTAAPDPAALQKRNQLLTDIEAHDQANIQTAGKLKQLYQSALFENKQHKQMLRYTPGTADRTETPHYLDTKH